MDASHAAELRDELRERLWTDLLSRKADRRSSPSSERTSASNETAVDEGTATDAGGDTDSWPDEQRGPPGGHSETSDDARDRDSPDE